MNNKKKLESLQLAGIFEENWSAKDRELFTSGKIPRVRGYHNTKYCIVFWDKHGNLLNCQNAENFDIPDNANFYGVFAFSLEQY